MTETLLCASKVTVTEYIKVYTVNLFIFDSFSSFPALVLEEWCDAIHIICKFVIQRYTLFFMQVFVLYPILHR